MQLQISVPLKTPLQTLHDIVTHNVTPVDKVAIEQQLLEEEGDDESTAGNFREVAREANLSPVSSAKTAKKTRKQIQNREPVKPTRILPRRAASQNK